MKVIYAGFSKCGTKSMAQAFRDLGLVVYDFMDNYEKTGAEWKKIFKEGGTTEDFRRMFENVDAVTDVPNAFFWEQIHQAFPEAKIIFSQRDEDEWWISFRRQILASDNFMEKLCAHLSPSWYLFNHWFQLMLQTTLCKGGWDSVFRPMEFNEMRFRMIYRQHNIYVLQHAPKDKLLVIDLADGWEPICKFLDLPVPQTPFPHKNKKSNLKNELDTKTTRRIKVEVNAMLLLLSSLSVFAALKTYKNPRFLLNSVNKLMPLMWKK